jgi:hypothetical protein
LIKPVPEIADFIICQDPLTWFGGWWRSHSINGIMIEVSPADCKADHCPDILECSPSDYGRIRELSVEDTGDISPVQIGKRAMTDNGQDIFTQSAFDLVG